MLCDLYTQTGTVQHLDAEAATGSLPAAGSSRVLRLPCTRISAKIVWVLALGELLFLPVFLQPNAQASARGHRIASYSILSSRLQAAIGNPASSKAADAPHRAHPLARRHQPQKKSAPAVVAQPAPPPWPTPPAEQQATPAAIAFHQGVLSIHAQNSSLIAILHQVSQETGLVIEGLTQDKRLYGQYGPGNLTDTLTALLDGAGYNYILVGGGSDHTPNKLILSQNSNTGAAVSPVATDNAAVAPTNLSVAPGTANPSQPVRAKTPQEIFDELRKMHPQ